MSFRIFLLTFVLLIPSWTLVLAANIETDGGKITAYDVPPEGVFMIALYRDGAMLKINTHPGSGVVTANPMADFEDIKETDTVKAFLWDTNTLSPLCNSVTTNIKEINESDNSVKVTINGHSFKAVLYDNETAKAFKSMLPLTITMNELNGNEKYHYFNSSLPTDSTRPGTIHEGDLMLYGSNCLVLFYETFSSSYSYTKIGYIENPSGLKNALGNGNVTVRYE
jgi:hypothetical protein